jgi:hypothetical protein
MLEFDVEARTRTALDSGIETSIEELLVSA